MRFEKYVRALDMLNRIETEDQALKVGFTDLPEPRVFVMREEAALRNTDELLEYLHANWPEPSSATSTESGQRAVDDETAALCNSCGQMLNMKQEEFEQKLETLPPFFCEYIFPISAVRYVLRELQAPFRHRQSKHFGEFSRRYANLILGC